MPLQSGIGPVAVGQSRASTSPLSPFNRRVSSSSSISLSSPRSGISWYSTDSESEIKISKPINSVTGRTIYTTPKTPRTELDEGIFSLPSPSYQTSESSQTSLSSRAASQRNSAGSQEDVFATPDRHAQLESSSDDRPLVDTKEKFSGLSILPTRKMIRNVWIKRSLSEGGSPLGLGTGLVLADAATKLDPHVLCHPALQNPYSSNKSGGTSFSTIPFEHQDPRFFELDVDTTEENDSPCASLVGESEETALTSEQGDTWDEWLGNFQERRAAGATQTPNSSRLGHVFDNDTSQAEVEKSGFVTDKSIHSTCTGNMGGLEISLLRREVASLKSEVERLRRGVMRANATVTGITAILDRFDIARSRCLVSSPSDLNPNVHS